VNALPGLRTVLVDDHRLFRAGIRALLGTLPDVSVVGEAEDGREALHLVQQQDPDVVLMDIMMPNLNGLDATARIVRSHPRTRVIVLSMNADEDSVLKTLRAGAIGYLVKTADPAELELALRAAAHGKLFLSSAIAAHVVNACLGRVGHDQTSLERLTPRLREVLQLVAEGNTTKEIARKLDISTKTAEEYRGALMKTLDIHDVASLTRYAIRMGLVLASP
jgi:DNA-binding NarL/FixJ family response regulator